MKMMKNAVEEKRTPYAKYGALRNYSLIALG